MSKTLRIFVDPGSIIQYDSERGLIEVEADNPEFTSPFIAVVEEKQGKGEGAGYVKEYKSYHLRCTRNGAIKLIPYRSLR